MKNTNTTYLLCTSLLALLCAEYAFAFPQDIGDRIRLRNELFLSSQKIKPFLTDKDVRFRLKEWVANDDEPHTGQSQTYMYECVKWLGPFFPAENILFPLCYVIRQNDPKIKGMYQDLVERFFLETKVALQDIKQSPRYEEIEGINDGGTQRNYQALASKLYNQITPERIQQVADCFKIAYKFKYDTGVAAKYPFITGADDSDVQRRGITQCLRTIKVGRKKFLPINLVDLFSYNLDGGEDEFKILHSGHAHSETGWIPGNRVSYLTWNNPDTELRDWLANSRDKLLTATNDFLMDNYVEAAETQGTFEYYMRHKTDEVFTDEIYNFATHPVWNQKQGIFNEMRETLQGAKKTILMDVFFLGGSMGVALSKELIRLVEANKNLKVFILKDNHNYFAYKKEMKALFNFLRAYATKNPKQFVVSRSHVEGHTSGLPSVMVDLVNEDKFFVSSGLKQHLISRLSDEAGLYIGAKSDHSKTIVIDGKSKDPKHPPTAFTGSKNFTDSSGGYCYDEVVKIQGPAAAITLDDYYYDMFFALRDEMMHRYPKYVEHVLYQGWAKEKNKAFKPSKALASLIKDEKELAAELPKINQAIANLLHDFEFLNRKGDHTPQVAGPVQTPAFYGLDEETFEPIDLPKGVKDNVWLRTGFNNVDSTRTNAVDQVIEMINFAKSYIFIQDQFLFDRNVINSLIAAKKANPKLVVRVILEGLRDVVPKGIPNILYIDQLVDAGIEVKYKKTLSSQGVSQEFHMKTISADGKYLISGSANKDQTTMYGAFREQQVDMYCPLIEGKLDPDCGVAIHDSLFMKRWKASDGVHGTADFKPFDFELAGIPGFEGNDLATKKSFIEFLRSVVSILFDAEYI